MQLIWNKIMRRFIHSLRIYLGVVIIVSTTLDASELLCEPFCIEDITSLEYVGNPITLQSPFKNDACNPVHEVIHKEQLRSDNSTVKSRVLISGHIDFLRIFFSAKSSLSIQNNHFLENNHQYIFLSSLRI